MAGWRRFGWAWNELGKSNALGAILTRDGRVADWNLAEFLTTGPVDAARFMDDLRRIAPRAGHRRALDFGCGVGRVTRALAEYFDQVVGIDVAPSMIERAQALHADCPRCTFVLNRAPDLSGLPSGSFDVAYSRLVLQHIAPAVVRRYLPELLRVIAPGGVLMFQLPESAPEGSPDLEAMRIAERTAFENALVSGSALKRALPRPLIVGWRRLKFWFIVRRAGAQIEMFGMPRPEVEALIRDAGGHLLAVNPDQSHGSGPSGFEYRVTRS